MQEIFLKQVNHEIEEVSDLFYQNKLDEGKKRLPELVTQLSKLSAYVLDQDQYNKILVELVETMESENYIMLADILIYEVLDMIVDTEG
jgi:hypothetical protein